MARCCCGFIRLIKTLSRLKNHSHEKVIVAGGRTIHKNLEKAGVKHVYYESPNTAHEWQTWRRSLYHFAPLLFQN